MQHLHTPMTAPVDHRQGLRTPRAVQALRWCVGAALGLSVLIGGAHAQSADTVGVHYVPAIKVEGTPLMLNGTGVSYRAVAKLYTVGLYVPQKSSKADVIFSTNGPKELRFVMLQGMRVDEIGKVITKGIETNSSREEFFRLIPAIRTMGEQFSRIRRMNANDVLSVEYVPKRGTMFYVNGVPAGLPIADTSFFPAVLRVWLGNRPTTQDLKDALLDFRAPPVLDALL
jgi:Chalcone isomerase-like